MKRLTKITSAEDASRLSDMIKQIEDDFDYLIAGLEKLDRGGKDSSMSGESVAEELQSAIQSGIEAVSNLFIE